MPLKKKKTKKRKSKQAKKKLTRCRVQTTTTAAKPAEDAKPKADAKEEDSGPHFEPLVSLPEVESKHGEEDEDVTFKM
jgi:hypothetical protein